MTTGAFPTGVSGIHTARENTRIVGFVLGIVEDTPFHPIGPFVVASFAVLAFCGFQVAQVLKDEDSSPIPLSKLNNAVTHQMSYLLIHISDVVPEMHVVLFVLCNNDSLASVACDAA
jgi:hypothetical protein